MKSTRNLERTKEIATLLIYIVQSWKKMSLPKSKSTKEISHILKTKKAKLKSVKYIPGLSMTAIS